jgi:hypothetical protein
LAKGIYKLLSDALPDGASLDEDVINKESRERLAERCKEVGNEIFYTPDGQIALRIVEQGQPLKNEILLEDVLAETLIGGLIKNKETSFNDLMIYYKSQPGQPPVKGLTALRELLKAPRTDGMVPLFTLHAVKSQTAFLKGGIDLTPARMNLQTKTDSRGSIQFYLDPAMLAELQRASGFVPVIISIQPMRSLRLFLGLKESLSYPMAAVP